MPRHQRVYPDEYRPRAREMRSQGLTYREIMEALGGDIPKNTISGWVSDIALDPEQRARIRQIELEARARGRPLATEWHRERKRQRLEAAETWAEPVAHRAINNADALMLMAAALWLGEGAKRDDILSLGNSDPRIVQGWLAILRHNFEIDEQKLACRLCLSEGMPDNELKAFWSRLTGIPLERFQKSTIKAGIPSKVRDGYKGVCVVIYHSSDLRRKVGALGWKVLELLSNTGL